MLRRTLLPLLILALGAGPARAEPSKPPNKGVEVAIDRWLVLDPALLPEAMLGTNPDLLPSNAPLNLQDLMPKPAALAPGPTGQALAWKPVQAPEGTLTLPLARTSCVTYAACYLQAPRFEQLTLKATGIGPYQVFLDAEPVAKTSLASTLDVPLILTRGAHRLVIKRVKPTRGDDRASKLVCKLYLEAPLGAQDVPKVTLDPARPMTLADVRDWPNPTELALSPDGSRLAVVVTTPDADHKGWSRDLFIRSTTDGRLLETLRVAKSQGDPVWSHDGKHLAFTAYGHRQTDLWVYGLSDRALKRVVCDGREIHGVVWSQDNRTLYYGTSESARADEPDALYERLLQLGDRRPDNRDRTRLNVASLDGALHQQLTFGDINPAAWALSPDGKTLALIESIETPTRPFEREELVTLDIETLALHREMPLPVGTSELTYSPDGRRLAVLSSPAEVSDSEPEHNRAYSTVFVVTPSSHQSQRLFQDTRPVTSHVYWNQADNRLAMLVSAGAETRLVRVDPAKPEHLVTLGVPANDLHTLSVSEDGRLAACVGSSLDEPEHLIVRPIHAGTTRVFEATDTRASREVTFGKHERWTFRNAHGDTIDGWLLFPSEFDPERHYPLIVYYYGGALPTTSGFNRERAWLAANGYVVYVLNPSGAYGYGERFADLHVNDWGDRAADDIVTGVKTLLAAKPYLDPKRVGNYGGSYGGFMTMDLATKTDLFKASCAMYGISDIAGYWGGGFWGYGYGDYALAKSYPWNRPDIYAERSPLYRADKIKTPLLLLHGTGDVNVPSLESDEMFTALKILGKDVAYVRFQNQDHGIRGTPAHRAAVDAMLLEWFDKHLKDQPEGWAARWKETRQGW